eukprot:CAMPEP_0185177052 /NCGR_PEP_ID=MMETSP1139-20130426/29194_1 /TAXON_ID=298111 /ORGANISM="Pavlova sp., Strain CCMP459" /LENGTH=73 /DNA_ID=CAMNT_0027742835 /DNA_START=23 /DNA_END=241 /DNA_ORIENTATION=-
MASLWLLLRGGEGGRLRRRGQRPWGDTAPGDYAPGACTRARAPYRRRLCAATLPVRARHILGRAADRLAGRDW